jgi:hypothetical protein
MSEAGDKLEEQRFTELFHVKRSVRYHNTRRQFYEWLDRFSTGISLVFGSAAGAAALSSLPYGTSLAVFSGFFVAIVSAFTLVMSAVSSARVHHELSMRFLQLELEITAVPPANTTPEHIRDWIHKRRRIDADEPPTMKAIDVMAHNELIRSGFSESQDALVHVKWYHRWFANWWTFNGTSWEYEVNGKKNGVLESPDHRPPVQI